MDNALADRRFAPATSGITGTACRASDYGGDFNFTQTNRLDLPRFSRASRAQREFF
jgi:hypothetical protein